MKKSFLSSLIAILIICSTTLAATFSDISGMWAESYITELSNLGVINGYPDGTYRPNDTLTYGEYIKLIVTASLPESDFSMLENKVEHWAGQYLTILENYEIVEEGTITKDVLNQKISRIEVVRILGECDIKIRKNVQKGSLLDFVDISEIDDMEKTLLRHAVATGVINGDPDGKFRPNDELKRSEVAKIIYTYTKM